LGNALTRGGMHHIEGGREHGKTAPEIFHQGGFSAGNLVQGDRHNNGHTKHDGAIAVVGHFLFLWIADFFFFFMLSLKNKSLRLKAIILFK
jgi:hypothetical protein